MKCDLSEYAWRFTSRPLMRAAKLLVVVLSLAMLAGACCAIRPAPSGLGPPSQSVYEPLVNAKLVTIEVIRVNGQTAPGRSLEKAIEKFGSYVAGEVRVVDGEPVEFDLGDDGALHRRQFQSVVDGSKHSGPSTITIILCPDLDFSEVRGFYGRGERSDGDVRHIVAINARMTDLTASNIPLVTRKRYWYVVILHELCHALMVPSDPSHGWQAGQCTHPECILYPGIDKRSIWAAILRLGPPRGLCRACRREIRVAQAAANDTLIDPQQH